MRVYTNTRSPVASLATILAQFQQQLQDRNLHWTQRLESDPSSFGSVEVEVHQTMQQAADQIVSGLLGQLGGRPALVDAGKKSR